MKDNKRDLTPPYAKYLGPLTRPFPDFDFFFIRSLRQEAADLLELKPGDRVLDAGCGSGGSFPYLVDRVGPSGEVVGIEISPETCDSARRRIAKNNWNNVSVLESPAQTVVLSGKFDALLMFAALDVFASEEALENLFPCLNDYARVVFFGAKMSDHPLGKLVGPGFRWAVSKLSFPTTPLLEPAPWRIAERRMEKVEVEQFFFKLMFLASGTVKAK